MIAILEPVSDTSPQKPNHFKLLIMSLPIHVCLITLLFLCSVSRCDSYESRDDDIPLRKYKLGPIDLSLGRTLNGDGVETSKSLLTEIGSVLINKQTIRLTQELKECDRSKFCDIVDLIDCKPMDELSSDDTSQQLESGETYVKSLHMDMKSEFPWTLRDEEDHSRITLSPMRRDVVNDSIQAVFCEHRTLDFSESAIYLGYYVQSNLSFGTGWPIKCSFELLMSINGTKASDREKIDVKLESIDELDYLISQSVENGYFLMIKNGECIREDRVDDTSVNFDLVITRRKKFPYLYIRHRIFLDSDDEIDDEEYVPHISYIGEVRQHKNKANNEVRTIAESGANFTMFPKLNFELAHFISSSESIFSFTLPEFGRFKIVDDLKQAEFIRTLRLYPKSAKTTAIDPEYEFDENSYIFYSDEEGRRDLKFQISLKRSFPEAAASIIKDILLEIVNEEDSYDLRRDTLVDKLGDEVEEENRSYQSSYKLSQFASIDSYHKENSKLHSSRYTLRVLSYPMITAEVDESGEFTDCSGLVFEMINKTLLDCRLEEHSTEATTSTSPQSNINKKYIKRSDIKVKLGTPFKFSGAEVGLDLNAYPFREDVVKKRIHDIASETNITSLGFSEYTLNLGYHVEARVELPRKPSRKCSFDLFMSVNRTRDSSDNKLTLSHVLKNALDNGYLLSIKNARCERLPFSLAHNMDLTVIERKEFPYLAVSHRITSWPLRALYDYKADLRQTKAAGSDFWTHINVTSFSFKSPKLNFMLNHSIPSSDFPMKDLTTTNLIIKETLAGWISKTIDDKALFSSLKLFDISYTKGGDVQLDDFLTFLYLEEKFDEYVKLQLLFNRDHSETLSSFVWNIFNRIITGSNKKQE